jgi:hypothetical protein
MGHYRGRDDRKARARRRKKHEARLAERVDVERVVADIVRYGIPAMRRAWAAFGEGLRMAAAAVQTWHASAVLFAQEQQDQAAPEEPTTLPELRRQLGGDGADLGRRAFDNEGKITGE